MFQLQVDRMGGASFVDDPGGELARILRCVADDVAAGAAGTGVLFDYNGARVGAWSLHYG